MSNESNSQRAADRDAAPAARETYENSAAVLRLRLQHTRALRAELPTFPAGHPLAAQLDAAITKTTSELSLCEAQIARCDALLLPDRVHELPGLEEESDRARGKMDLARVKYRAQAGVWFAYIAQLRKRNGRSERPAPARTRSAPASDAREQIWRQSPGQRRGPPEPDPLLSLLDQLVSNIVALRTQIAATRTQPSKDDWIPQSEAPCPSRVFTRATRKYRAFGDDRAVVRGRVHYMRRSLLDEFMRGSPQPKRAPNKVAPEAHLSPLESLRRDFDLAMAEAAE